MSISRNLRFHAKNEGLENHATDYSRHDLGLLNWEMAALSIQTALIIHNGMECKWS